MSVLTDYPYCNDIVASRYIGLFSSQARKTLYVRRNNESFVFENPIYCDNPATRAPRPQAEGGTMRTKDFLASIPSFADFTDEQLITLEQKSTLARFAQGEVIFQQAEEGEKFYVINQGTADVLIQESPDLLKKGDLGKIVNRLTEGCYFGERALMTAELRAASIRAMTDTVCLVFSRAVYEEVISGSNALIGSDLNAAVDWSKDHETRSLFKHIENILDIDTMTASPKIKRILYELTTAFTPELSADEVISRMVMTVKIALKVDRVGLFVLSEDKRSMILKVSERSKGIRLPVRGLAGAVVQGNEAINIADAYQDGRFDATMDRRTGYRTRQILGVPLKHPLSGEAIGLLQVNNRLDGSFEGFSAEQQRVLELAAEQLSELLYGRADVFIQSGSGASDKAFGAGVGDGLTLLNSADLKSQFHISLGSIDMGERVTAAVRGEGLTQLEIHVSLHLALGQLCPLKKVHINDKSSMSSKDLDRLARENEAKFAKAAAERDRERERERERENERESEWKQEGSVGRRPARRLTRGKSTYKNNIHLNINQTLDFDIAVSDLPRATRVLFQLWGWKSKGRGKPDKNGDGNVLSPHAVFLGWAACTVFDFKGCVDGMQSMHFFPPSAGVVEVPINTTLNNENDPDAAMMSVVLAPDLMLAVDSATPRVRIVHSMPVRLEPIESDLAANVTEAHCRELDRILHLSFNPLSASMMTEMDKAFLWDLRYSLLNRAELLPAFVMSVQWHNSEQVQELYDLLDLWAPPSPVQSLQLLDRRFMDPKVRAYAVHCLEELPDDELALYMLQLCQQLKFEAHVDSALARFLLRRALTRQRLIGHIYYWLLQSEVYNQDVAKRYVILLQVYIRNCGSHRVELGHQMFVMKRLESVAEAVCAGESKADRKAILHARLSEIVLPSSFKLPLNPHLNIGGIDVSRCRVMESKKKPLWLTLKDATTGADIVLMLKVGDDLRQDALIMQLLRVMNDLWQKEGLDMQMKLYDCISTGHERGLLQVVLNANTLGNILQERTDRHAGALTSKKSGSLSRKISAAMKAMSDYSVLSDWISEQVDIDVEDPALRPAELEQRTQNFMISTAAYCVASYVLGLGDRHNDNLMMTRTGHFFHIDFGHILGNFKSKMGVKRERAPFVFPPAMKHVMRGEDQFEGFVDLCCDVYNILREHSMLLVSLFSLAIPCNLPELQAEKDVMWIYDKLLVAEDDETAAEHFRGTLDIALSTRSTRLNDAAHMLAHA
mmetsp:Transcript_34230/g.75420  ORF Transcript_34230/g.75420 Transcript_34230/m.75420 type:complete len:1239 (+) Transcript_34230:443-4159(+)